MTLNPIQVISKRIQETEHEIDRVIEEYGEFSIEYDFLFSSLNKRLNQLKVERNHLLTNEGTENLRLILRGEGIGKGTISARILGPVLHELQSLTDNIANKLVNEPSPRGTIPYEILENSTLMLTKTFEGSFGIELKAYLSQMDMFDDPLITRSLDRFYELVTTEIDPDKILDQVSDLGSRTFRHYRKLIEALDSSKISFDLEWDSVIRGDYRWSFQAHKIHELRELLNTISESETEELLLGGTLTAGSIRRNTFELEVNDETGFKYLIKGKTKHNILKEKNISFGDYVEATLNKTTASIISTGSTKESWYLKDIRVIPLDSDLTNL